MSTNRFITPRHLLLAGVSVIALTVALPEVRAADVPMAARPPVLKAPAPKAEITWFVEGAGTWTAGDRIFFPRDPAQAPLTDTLSAKPRFGWQGAIGIDYRFPPNSPAWHVSAQFRYGQARRTKNGFFQIYIPPGNNTTTYAATGEAKHRETHWVADFAVGRDNGIGSNQVKLGVRVAEIKAKTRFTGLDTANTGLMTSIQESKFLGVGPRLSAEGSMPAGGQWMFDYMAGVAVLFGERKLSNATCHVDFDYCGGVKVSDHATVLNADASIGLSYFFTPNAKFTLGYRADAYWNVLKTFNASAAVTNIDRIIHGPFLRATAQY